RFLRKVWRLYVAEGGGIRSAIRADAEAGEELVRLYHKTVKKVTEDIEELRFNTAISQMMIFVNEAAKAESLPRSMAEGFVLILSPFAPHLAEELWERLGHKETLAYEPWPEYDPEWVQDDMVEIVFNVNGKLRDKALLPADAGEEEIKAAALASERVQRAIAGKQIVRTITVPGKLCNLVVKQKSAGQRPRSLRRGAISGRPDGAGTGIARKLPGFPVPSGRRGRPSGRRRLLGAPIRRPAGG